MDNATNELAEDGFPPDDTIVAEVEMDLAGFAHVMGLNPSENELQDNDPESIVVLSLAANGTVTLRSEASDETGIVLPVPTAAHFDRIEQWARNSR